MAGSNSTLGPGTGQPNNPGHRDQPKSVTSEFARLAKNVANGLAPYGKPLSPTSPPQSAGQRSLLTMHRYSVTEEHFRHKIRAGHGQQTFRR